LCVGDECEDEEVETHCGVCWRGSGGVLWGRVVGWKCFGGFGGFGGFAGWWYFRSFQLRVLE
jgi:hypothetical protein